MKEKKTNDVEQTSEIYRMITQNKALIGDLSFHPGHLVRICESNQEALFPVVTFE